MTYKQSFEGMYTFASREARDAGLAAAEGYLDEIGRGASLEFIYGDPMTDTTVTFGQTNFFPASMYEELEGALRRLAEYAIKGCVICTFELDGISEMMICATGSD